MLELLTLDACMILTIALSVFLIGLLMLAFYIVRKARPEDLPEIVKGLACWWRGWWQRGR